MEWEYRTLTLDCGRSHKHDVHVIDETHDKKLNQFGSDGWELVSVVPVLQDDLLTAATYVFKRPREGASWQSR
jgi:Domain of unknown function (DUF4177)